MLRQLMLVILGWNAGQAMAAAGKTKCVQERDASGKMQKVCYRFVDEERVLNKLSVLPSNGGINPAMAAYEIRGQVQIAGNSCYAQGLKSSLETRQIEGNTYAVARVTGWQRADLMCIEVYQPVRSSVQLTLRGKASELAQVRIKNIGEQGLEANLSSPCLRPSACPEGGQPTVCYFDELEFYGESRCQAEEDARKNACLKGVELDTLLCEDSVERL